MQLVDKSDVVIENFSEGTTARLGVDYARVRQRNPRVVYGSVKAMGEPSAFPGLKGMDIIVQALSGLMEVTGFADGPPTRCGLPIADLLAPMYAVNGILAALIHRGRTGEGTARVGVDAGLPGVLGRGGAFRCHGAGGLSGPQRQLSRSPCAVRRVSDSGW
ncbi:putative acyl-CoA transferase/carnitine dehydratase [Candidatus Paraburkholderia kirkii]|nr:putative acyl-CoA transferase/carnitine dehydratase [Candidatus Paraburkholderia kirkii]